MRKGICLYLNLTKNNSDPNFLSIFLNFLTFALFIIIGISYTYAQDSIRDKTFNVGLKIVDFEYNHDGYKEIVTAAVWYPTEKAAHQYTYYKDERRLSVESKIALDAPLSTKGRPYPLVLFSHGGYGCGYNTAFFMEYLASHGYIAVAPDYTDTKPPEYKEQIAFNRIKGGNVGNPLRVLGIVGRFVSDMNANREFLVSYLNEHRFNQTSFVINKMIALNNDPDSIFYQSIKEEAIGIAGHSLGGATILGKIGAHPNGAYKDNRIKAALIFSAPVYPFEESIQNINVPIMSMAGDNDEPGVGPQIPRRVLYDKAQPPKFYFILKNANHLAFGNSVCDRTPLYQAAETNTKANAICRYGLAFFEKYLRGNLSAEEQLEKMDSAWAYYIKEEKKGEVLEWGKEPAPGKGGPGGIREELGGQKGARGWFRRWQDK